MLTLNDFITTYTGKITGDTSENTGECVGLVEVWSDNLDQVHVWGNAIDLYSNAPGSDYLKGTGWPAPLGAIVTFGVPYGQLPNGSYAGHTGISLGDDRIFQQNNPDGSTPHVSDYGPVTPKGYIGYILPRNFNPTGDDMIAQDDVNNLYLQFLGRPYGSKPEDAGSWVGGNWHDAYYGIKDSAEAQTYGAAKDQVLADALAAARPESTHDEDDSGDPPIAAPPAEAVTPTAPSTGTTPPVTPSPVVMPGSVTSTVGPSWSTGMPQATGQVGQATKVDSLSKVPQPVLVKIQQDEQEAVNWLGTTLGSMVLKLAGAALGWLVAHTGLVQTNDVAASIVGMIVGSTVSNSQNPAVPNTPKK